MVTFARSAFRTFSLVTVFAAAACGSSSSNTGPQQPRIIRNPEQQAEQGGIPSDKEAEIRLVLQNREPTALRCYTDELNERKDRKFEGVVQVLITIQPSGQASDVKIMSSTLASPEVEGCLVEKIRGFEFPQLEHAGQIQYSYRFRPAY